jgi:hypothetical protein
MRPSMRCGARPSVPAASHARAPPSPLSPPPHNTHTHTHQQANGAHGSSSGGGQARGVLGSFMSSLKLRVAGSAALTAEDLAPALADMKVCARAVCVCVCVCVRGWVRVCSMLCGVQRGCGGARRSGRGAGCLARTPRTPGLTHRRQHPPAAARLPPPACDTPRQRKLMERNVAEEIAAKVVGSVAQGLEGQKLSSFTGARAACVCVCACACVCACVRAWCGMRWVRWVRVCCCGSPPSPCACP